MKIYKDKIQYYIPDSPWYIAIIKFDKDAFDKRYKMNNYLNISSLTLSKSDNHGKFILGYSYIPTRKNYTNIAEIKNENL